MAWNQVCLSCGSLRGRARAECACRRRGHEQRRNGHLGNSGCEHRRLPGARPWRFGRRPVRLLQGGVHGSRRARARSGLVGVALRAEHHVARAIAGRRDVPGIGRRADVLVRMVRSRTRTRTRSARRGFLELQFYPDSVTKNCGSTGSFSLVHAPDVYTACSPVWTLAKQGQQIAEPAAFNGMLTDAGGKAPFVMHALDIVDVHIWAPGSSSPYQEQVTDENERADVERARAHQPEGRPADSGVQHAGDRQCARLGRCVGHADGIRLGDRPLGPLRRPSRPVLHSGPDVLRLVQHRQTGPASSRSGSSAPPSGTAHTSSTGPRSPIPAGRPRCSATRSSAPPTARRTVARTASTRGSRRTRSDQLRRRPQQPRGGGTSSRRRQPARRPASSRI